MSIIFHCQHCHKEVKAPDEAGGKRGKCPFCGQSNYIPAPVKEEEILAIQPLDENEEHRRQEQIEELVKSEEDILAQTGENPKPPLDQREDVTSEDLHHLVVNYCLDMARSSLDSAGEHVKELKRFGYLGRKAVEDFLTGRASEPALDAITKRVREGFLKQLSRELRSS